DTRPDGYIWNGDAGTWTYSPQPFTLSHPPEIETVPFWIGHSRFQFWAQGNTYFNGTIDEVAVYNRSLSKNEITEHYTQGVIKPVVSPYCAYLGSLSTTDLADIDYTSRNSSYSKFCFGVNNSKIGGINTTNTFYIAYESETTTGNYTVRYANGSSGTNVSFNDSKVAWSSTNNATNWTQAKFTPDLWLASINSGDIFQLGVYVENSTGANYTNFMLYSDPIKDDITPPVSIIGLDNSTIGQTYINWTWTDPSDADFAEVMIYLNGTFITNVSKDVEHYNATGLTPDTNYTISTHTIDTSGNINNTWVNDSATTLYDNTPPLSIIGLDNSTIGQTYINWTWTDPSDADFAEVMIYLNGTFITNVSKDVEHYNATGLTPDTNYTISTHTIDTSGNINNTWVNDSATSEYDYTPPLSIIGLDNSTIGQTYINWTWT
ncbi:MAG: hypothetical protein U9P81_01030, partial [Euryarchaeota archaeon]|nr:hypothetical protein [Euryarchaeota archaeon]